VVLLLNSNSVLRTLFIVFIISYLRTPTSVKLEMSETLSPSLRDSSDCTQPIRTSVVCALSLPRPGNPATFHTFFLTHIYQPILAYSAAKTMSLDHVKELLEDLSCSSAVEVSAQRQTVQDAAAKLSPKDAMSLLEHLNTQNEKLEEDVKTLRKKNATLKAAHPAINKTSKDGLMWARHQDPEAYRQSVLVRVITYAWHFTILTGYRKLWMSHGQRLGLTSTASSARWWAIVARQWKQSRNAWKHRTQNRCCSMAGRKLQRILLRHAEGVKWRVAH
jgi:hypothetical protein